MVFSQSPKNPKMTFWRQSRLNEAKILKSSRVTFEALLSPNFIPNFKKIIGAVFEICRSGRTDIRTDGRMGLVL